MKLDQDDNQHVMAIRAFQGSNDHHDAIIEVDEHGNRVRKSTHYSMKKIGNKVEEVTK
jgi:hypothetical protein